MLLLTYPWRTTKGRKGHGRPSLSEVITSPFRRTQKIMD